MKLASSLFESVFEPVTMAEENSEAKYKLNSNVIKPGAIVRVWNSLNQLDGSESHSVVTIDYKNRRVSFDTNNPVGVKVKLGNVEQSSVAHCISSPEVSFVKKIARVFFENKEYYINGSNKGSLTGKIILKGIGVLTPENIKILHDYLIVNAINMKHNYVSEIYTKHKDTYFAVQPVYRISSNLYYNKRSNIVLYSNKNLVIDEEGQKTSLKGSEMMPINCASFIELLFPNIIYRVNTLSLSMLGYMKYIPTTPSMLRPIYEYNCLDNIYNEIDIVTAKLSKLELPASVEYNILKTTGVIGLAKKRGGLVKYMAQASLALASFILWILPYGIITGILAGSYLIIPLEFKEYFTDINPNYIISNIKELFSSILCNMNISTFSFSPTCDINTLSISELKSKYGDNEIDTFTKVLLFRKNTKPDQNLLAFKFNSEKSVRKSRRRKSVRKSRRRKSVRKSVRKSHRRKSIPKSRRRKSIRKSRRRKSVRKSRRRKSVRKSRRRK